MLFKLIVVGFGLCVISVSPVEAMAVDLSGGVLRIDGYTATPSSLMLSEFDQWIPSTSNARSGMDRASCMYMISNSGLQGSFFLGMVEAYSLVSQEELLSDPWKIAIGCIFIGSACLIDYVIPGELENAVNGRLVELRSSQRVSIDQSRDYLTQRRRVPGTEDVAFWSAIPGMYYVSKSPDIIGGAYLFGLALGATAKGKTEITRLWYPVGISAYNFSIAKSQSQSDVFWTNIGMMGMWMVTDTLSTSDQISERAPTPSIAIEPFIVNGSLGLAVSTGF